MSTRYTAVTIMMIVLTLLVGCGKAEPTATPTNAPIPPTVESPPTATSTTELGVTSNTWMRAYGGNQYTFGWYVLLADDGGYFIVGATNLQYEPEMRGDVYLIRTDAAGEVLWEKIYGGEGYEEGQSITQASDGGLVIAGRRYLFAKA